MAQLIVRNLEDDIRDRLKELAGANGRSMEEEVRAILRAAVLKAELESAGGLGSRVSERFSRYGFEAGDIEEHKGQAARPADLET